jgi:hypothetical protein
VSVLCQDKVPFRNAESPSHFIAHTQTRVCSGAKEMERRIAGVHFKTQLSMCVLCRFGAQLYCFSGSNCAILPVHFNDCNKSFDTFYRQIAIPPIKRNLLKPKTLLEKIICHKVKNILPGIQPLCIKVDGFNHKDLY